MAVTFGTEYTTPNTSTHYSDCTVLDSTHIAVVYRGSSYDSDGIIRVGVVSNDDEISWGSEYVFWDYSEEDYDLSYCKVEKLDTNKLVIAWYTSVGSRSVIATVSNGNEVAFGTRSASGQRYFSELDLTVLSTSSFVIAGKNSQDSNYGTASVATVSGTDITYGSNYIFNSADTDYTSIDALDSTHFVVSYKDDGGDDYGCSKIGVISSSTVITFGDEYVFNSTNTEYIDNCRIDDTNFIISYRDTGNSGYGTAIIGTVSNGDEIAYGSEYLFKNSSTWYTSISVLDTGVLIVSWYDGAKSGTFSGDVISFSTSESSHSGASNNNAVCKITTTSFINVISSYSPGKAFIGLYTEDPVASTNNSIFFGMNF